jgi:cell division protein FtsZ
MTTAPTMTPTPPAEPTARRDEDLLDIPAFLRRQAN